MVILDSELNRGMQKQPTIDIIGVPVTYLSLREQISQITGWAEKRISKVVCVANVHMLMESRTNAKLRSILGKADLVTPDGMPIVWMMQLLGLHAQDRVAGMDIFEKGCCQCEQRGISIYLIGSTQNVLNKMKLRIQKEFPNLSIAGIESPPFRPLSQAENNATAERINKSGAGITFVSLGCPKQEQWMALHAGNIQSVMIGVGAVFPVYAKVLQHAPNWIRQSGLEWLYRWLQEPRRLSGRYVKTIPPFIYLALRQIQTEKIFNSQWLSPKVRITNTVVSMRKAKRPSPQRITHKAH
ncbi:MAG: WecB/TagA/CpsF family glycosyltransferase [Phormidesmis sp.]